MGVLSVPLEGWICVAVLEFGRPVPGDLLLRRAHRAAVLAGVREWPVAMGAAVADGLREVTGAPDVLFAAVVTNGSEDGVATMGDIAVVQYRDGHALRTSTLHVRNQLGLTICARALGRDGERVPEATWWPAEGQLLIVPAKLHGYRAPNAVVSEWEDAFRDCAVGVALSLG